MQSDVRQARREWQAAVVTFLVGAAILTWAVFFPIRPVVAYVGPRSTVERVKIFDCEFSAVALEGRMNSWLYIASGEVRVVNRTYTVSMSKQPCYSAAIFYEKLVERSADEKPLAEKP